MKFREDRTIESFLSFIMSWGHDMQGNNFISREGRCPHLAYLKSMNGPDQVGSLVKIKKDSTPFSFLIFNTLESK